MLVYRRVCFVDKLMTKVVSVGVCETSGQEVALWHLSTIAEAHTSSCTEFFAVENEWVDFAETCVYSCLIDNMIYC